MKPITWLNASKLNPNVTLDKLEEIATVRKGSNSISFSSFRYIEYIGIIQSQLKFPKTDEEIGQEWVVTKAVNRCLLSNSLNKNDLIEVANEVLADALAKQQDTYHLLTSISVGKAFPVRRIKVAGCVVSFYETSYPKKYKGREEAVHSNYASTHNIEHKNYIKCVVTTKAKYSKSAARKALYALDYIRACFCLMGNPVIEFNSGESFDKPINIIRLGKFHTLHNKLGKALEDELWFEPNFFEHAKVPLSHPDRHRNNLDHFQKKLAASKYSGTIRDSLVRYVRSCDERDSNTCFIKLWGTLESLLSPEQASHEKVVSRGASLYPDKLFHQHALDHLRRFRNKNIHAGEENQRSKIYCFQLHRYYQALMLFQLSNADFFDSVEEVNEFLDLPHDQKRLEQKGKLIEKALNLRHSTSLF